MPRFMVVTTTANGKRFNREYAVVDARAREQGRDASILETNSLARAIICRDENNNPISRYELDAIENWPLDKEIPW